MATQLFDTANEIYLAPSRSALINPTDEVMLRRIHAARRERQHDAFWERWTPLFIVLGVAVLCLVIVLTARP